MSYAQAKSFALCARIFSKSQLLFISSRSEFCVKTAVSSLPCICAVMCSLPTMSFMARPSPSATFGAATVIRPMFSQSSSISATSSIANTSVFSAPTLVPLTPYTFSITSISPMAFIAPASYAPFAPPPDNTSPTFMLFHLSMFLLFSMCAPFVRLYAAFAAFIIKAGNAKLQYVSRW